MSLCDVDWWKKLASLKTKRNFGHEKNQSETKGLVGL